MGRVYRARQFSPKRTVALKMILAGEFATSEARRRFQHNDLAPNSLIQVRLTDGAWLRFHWSVPTRVPE